MKWLNPAARKSPQNFLTRQSPLQQSLEDLQQGLHPVEVSPSHTILPVGMGDGMATRKHRERCVGVILQQEPCFLPPDWRVRQQNRKVGINIRPGADQDVHTAQDHRSCVRTLLQLGLKKVNQ
jgi:hypothetical protein